MAFSSPYRDVLGLPSPSPSSRVCTGVRTYADVTTKILGLIGYQICLAKELRWGALPTGSAIMREYLPYPQGKLLRGVRPVLALKLYIAETSLYNRCLFKIKRVTISLARTPEMRSRLWFRPQGLLLAQNPIFIVFKRLVKCDYNFVPVTFSPAFHPHQDANFSAHLELAR